MVKTLSSHCRGHRFDSWGATTTKKDNLKKIGGVNLSSA